MRFETQTNLYDNQPLITKLTSHDTRFDVVQGEINALISESEMTELINGGSTMYSAMNDIKIDVTGLHADISEMSSTIDGQSGQITQLNSRQATYEASLEQFSGTLSQTQSDLTSTTNRVTAVEATASGITTSVSNISTTLTTNYYTKNDVDGITSDLSSDIATALGDATSALQTQIDGKVETWYQSTDPSSAWTTTALKTAHTGDLLYYTGSSGTTFKHNTTYRWSGTGWVIQDAPDAVFDAIDEKAQIFTSTSNPTPPYNVGDLWFSSSTSDIMTCVIAKASGQSYSSSDWMKRNKYTDDTKANNALSAISTLETQVQATSTRVEQLDDSVTVVAERVEAMSVAGANILRGTTHPATDYFTLSNVTVTDDVFVLNNARKDSKIIPKTGYLKYGDYKNRQYTLSFEGKVVSDSSGRDAGELYLYIGVRPESNPDDMFSSSNSRYAFKSVTTTSSDWTLYSMTVLVPSDLDRGTTSALIDSNYLNCVILRGGDYLPFRIRKLKMELGDVATSWLPAMEDSEIYTDIKTDGAKDYADSQITIAKAEIKVTTDAIESTVSQKVDGQYVESQITQSADAIRLKANAIAWTSTNSSMTESGTLTCQNANVTGTINTTTGFIGNWIIHQDKIYGGTAETGVAVVQAPNATNAWVFAAGGDTHTTYGGCPFRVHKNGNLYAIGGNIAGFTMSDTGFAYAPNSGERLYMNQTQGFKTFNTSSKQSVEVYNGAVRFLHTTADGSKTYLDGYFSQNRDEIAEVATSFYFVASTTLTAKGTEKLRIHAQGITVNGTVTQTSDARLKKDIVDLDDKYLSLVDNIEPKQFRYIENDKRVNVGFIAQNAKEILEENDIHDDSIVLGTGEGSDYYSLDYSQFIPILVRKCQKQDERINQLEAKIEHLETIIGELLQK